MTAPSWILLPPDAPEPPPLSIVRDAKNGLWMRDPDDEDPETRWLYVTDSAVQHGPWARLQRYYAPLHLGAPDGVLTPLTASTEPTQHEVRRDGLLAAVGLLGAMQPDRGLTVGEVEQIITSVQLLAVRFEAFLTRP